MAKRKGHSLPVTGLIQEHIGLRVPKEFSDELAKLKRDEKLEAIGESAFYRMVLSCGIKNFSLADSSLDARASNKVKTGKATKVDGSTK